MAMMDVLRRQQGIAPSMRQAVEHGAISALAPTLIGHLQDATDRAIGFANALSVPSLQHGEVPVARGPSSAMSLSHNQLLSALTSSGNTNNIGRLSMPVSSSATASLSAGSRGMVHHSNPTCSGPMAPRLPLGHQGAHSHHQGGAMSLTIRERPAISCDPALVPSAYLPHAAAPYPPPMVPTSAPLYRMNDYGAASLHPALHPALRPGASCPGGATLRLEHIDGPAEALAAAQSVPLTEVLHGESLRPITPEQRLSGRSAVDMPAEGLRTLTAEIDGEAHVGSESLEKEFGSSSFEVQDFFSDLLA